MKSSVLLLVILYLLAAAYSKEHQFKIGGTDGEDLYVKCNVGDTIKLLLKANHSTGYAWAIPQYDNNEQETFVIRESDYEKDKADDPKDQERVGQGGTQMLLLVITAPGQEQIQLMYGRPWLKEKLTKLDNKLYNPKDVEGSDLLLHIDAELKEDL